MAKDCTGLFGVGFGEKKLLVGRIERDNRAYEEKRPKIQQLWPLLSSFNQRISLNRSSLR
jgi:hypothetical protein